MDQPLASLLAACAGSAATLGGQAIVGLVNRRNKRDDARAADKAADVNLVATLLGRIDKLEERVARTEAEVTTWREKYWAEVPALKAENADLRATIGRLTAQNGEQSGQISTLTHQTEEQAAQLANLEALIGELKGLHATPRRAKRAAV